MVSNLVSIIMPSYNSACYINEAINSVMSQTYSMWELIVVDDCSSDNTIEIIEKFNDKRIILLRNECRMGAAFSRNRAIKMAKGEWIAFLDSDDLWHTNKLENQLAFMKSNNYIFSYTNYYKIDENDPDSIWLCTGPMIVNKKKLYNYDYLGCLTVMYNRKLVGDIEIENISKNNDYAMWLKIIHKSDCYLLNETLAKYRARSHSISHDKIYKLIKNHYLLYRVCDNRSAIESIILTLRNLFFGVIKKIVYEKKIK